MKVEDHVLKTLEQFAAHEYSAQDHGIDGCGEASGCNSFSGECACHGDGYVW